MDVVVLLTSAMDAACPGTRGRDRLLRRVGRRLRLGGMLVLVGVSPPRLSPKTRLDDALLAAGYGNIYWQVQDLTLPESCPARRSFVILANKIWEC